jgi:hypothetical protein
MHLHDDCKLFVDMMLCSRLNASELMEKRLTITHKTKLQSLE